MSQSGESHALYILIGVVFFTKVYIVSLTLFSFTFFHRGLKLRTICSFFSSDKVRYLGTYLQSLSLNIVLFVVRLLPLQWRSIWSTDCTTLQVLHRESSKDL